MLDVDRNVFVDANDNAVKLFKLPREELLGKGPEALCPEFQSDGLPSARLASQLRRPCAARRPARLRVAAPRRSGQGHAVRSAVHSPAVLEATADPRQHPRQRGAPPSRHARVRRAARARARGSERAAREDAARGRAAHRAAASRRRARPSCCSMPMQASSVSPRPTVCRPASRSCSTKLPVGLRSGSCGVAASLGRQVVVRDIASDPLWAELASVAVANGVRACCSTPIVTAGDRDPRHARVVLRCRARPEHRGARPRHAADSARGHRDPPQAGRDGAARQRGALPRVVRQRRRRRLPGGAERRALVREPGARADAGPRGRRERSAAATWRSSSSTRRSARGSSASSRATAGSAISSISCARVRAASSSSSRTRGS